MALKQVEFRQGVRENAHWALNSKVVMMKRQSGKHLRATGLTNYTKGSPFVLTSFLSTWSKLESSNEGASTDKMPP